MRETLWSQRSQPMPAMCKRMALALAAALVLGCIVGTARATVYRDDAGREVVLEQPARRVVTLAPNLTELAYAVEGGAALVGTISGSDYPDAAKALPKVGDYQRLDVERILALRPDLLLVWRHGNAGRELEQLEAAGIRLYYLEPRRLDDVPRALERIGELIGHRDAGRARAEALRSDLAALRSRHAAAEPVRVYYQVWGSPLMTLNRDHLVNDVIELCGGRNVFADLAPLVPQLSTESVLVADPEVVLAAREQSDAEGGLRRDPGHADFARWQRFPRMTAVRHGWLYTLPGDDISRQGPRIVAGARAVCAALDGVRRERRVLAEPAAAGRP